jgi:hypothetical protein
MLTVCEDSHGRRLEHFCPGGHPNIGRSPLCVAYDQNLGCTTCILEDSHGPGEGLPRGIWKEGLPRAIWKDSHGLYGRTPTVYMEGRTPTGCGEGLPRAIWKDSHGLYGRTPTGYMEGLSMNTAGLGRLRVRRKLQSLSGIQRFRRFLSRQCCNDYVSPRTNVKRL